MSAWVLARSRMFGSEAVWQYWLGEVNQHGAPRWSTHHCDAQKFSSARCAYEAADTHRSIRDSDEWRAIRVPAGATRLNGQERRA